MIKVAQPFVGEEEVAAVREVLLSGKYVSGEKVAEFEKVFAEFIGTKFAVAVNSGTAALHLILAALGIGPGDEVIVPPLTFFSSVSCILHQNAIPVFADIDPKTYCLDPRDVERKITDRTKAIIVVHLFGQAAAMDALIEIAETRGIPVIEDCAQAHGTRYKGNVVGSLGTAGAFSFFATKHMTTGEGGLITTNTPGLAEKAKLMRSHGMSDRDTHVHLGYNYRMNEIAAAMGLVQLTKLPTLNKRRIQNSLYLIEGLKEITWLVPPQIEPHVEHTFFWVPFCVKEGVIGISTPELVRMLKENGVEVRHRYKEPLYRQPILLKQSGFGDRHPCPYQCPYHTGPNVDYTQARLPEVEKVAGRLIGLPNHPGLTEGELVRVVDIIKGLFRGQI
jgi:perosamine synthetase